MSTPSTLNEKEVEWRVQDQEAAAQQPKKYESIVSESLETAQVKNDLEINAEKQSTRNALSRLQSATSGFSQFTGSDLSDTKSSMRKKKKWYKKLNPLKWGPKPPVPEIRIVSREYNASIFSRLTFQWMAPLMTVRYTPAAVFQRLMQW